MRLVVLGATGFIGAQLTRWLAAAGHQVIAIHRGQTPPAAPGMETLLVDRRDPAGLGRALVQAAAEVVVDLIAYTEADVASLLAALPRSNGRLVVISSGDVYRTYDAFRGLVPPPEPAGPQTETDPLRERLYPYRGDAEGSDDLRHWYEKILVERAALAGWPGQVTILRLPMVYGPGDRQGRVAGCLGRLPADGSPLRLNPAEAGWRCTRGYVEDVAWAIALAATDERAAGRTLNVGETDALTELEWVGAIAQAAGWNGRVEVDPGQQPSLPANWSVPLVTDTRRIRELLDYKDAVGRAEGLRRTVRTGP